ncbi:LL-diaminopimelate aminotransferase [Tepidibacter formicigenes]|jgi:LL-diaminopimelate aminotransferase|uniref:Aminotransferase n=1 Tax=Tepidibacter formicigenes DSM 15518 TaxID=1123349 RepID=A0A1M6NP31_9FIRM|nr:LL-diaminopimelate aminotransferase [Tepidibacter formicigenes]SHJ97376.1 LL-diaminopimelate aminotransferase apoenzyme [Tepidibacter formicigenes DSM 15518]
MYFFDSKIANRLGGIDFFKNPKAYKFEKIKKEKEEIKKNYPNIPIIDLGVGEPDLPANTEIGNVLCRECIKPENRWYSDNGIPEFQEAAAKFLEKVYNLKGLNPYKNIMHGIGSKSILAMLPMCFINPGDITLATVPGYPIISNYTKFLGGNVYNLPLYKENNFYPDFSKIPKDILKKSKLLYINYPNNPTGQIATKEFYKEVIDFAYENDILVISDAAYSALVFDNNKPLSFLSVDGAMDVGLEIHSLSKSYNMTGWRLAFVVGNEKIIKAYSNIKGYTDSGQFRAIQKAGVYALNHPELIKENSLRYSRRFDLLVEALREVGFDAKKPKGTFYAYVPIPKGTSSGYEFKNAEDASNFILKNALVSTIPWDEAESFLRISVTFEAKDYEEEKKVIQELKNRLKKLDLVFKL